MMNSGATDPLTATASLPEAVEAAATLLYHAASTGQDLPASVRDPIIKVRAAVHDGGGASHEDEAKFLAAYAQLALRVSPVTAVTLAATSRRNGRRGWLASLLRLGPVSDAQRLASQFGLLALCLIAAIAFGEWTHGFIGSILTAEKQYAINAQEMREANIDVFSIEAQIERLAPKLGKDTAEAGAVRQALESRRDNVQKTIWRLEDTNRKLRDTIAKGSETLERILFLGGEKLRHVGNVLGGFLLPVLYGALGTCAFVMRSLFREMVDRTFDGRRTGEFKVRIFLGMLSGLTLQWLVVRSDGAIAGGTTPAVLAFLGGYSVEMLFTTLDRLVHLVAGRMRPSQRGQAARPRREPEAPGGPKRGRSREVPVNGGAPGAKPTGPVPTLTPIRVEAN
jgi:hypothetical protein